MTTPKARHQRKLINFLIDPRLQFLLFLPYIVTLLAFVLTTQLVMWKVISVFSQINLDPTSLKLMSLGDVLSNLMIISSAGFVLAGVIGYLLVVVVSHRILGPLFSIHRHVRRLNAGEFEHRIVLRKGDRLRELAEDLNTLTATVARLSGGAPKDTP